jgi:hypothetical protein
MYVGVGVVEVAGEAAKGKGRPKPPECRRKNLSASAFFGRPDGVLVDGQLVTVVVETAKPQAALVIPQQAVQIDQAGATRKLPVPRLA